MAEQTDHDSPARGCLNGVLAGTILWLIVAGICVAVWLTVR